VRDDRNMAHSREALHLNIASGYWDLADASASRSRTRHARRQPPHGAPQESMLPRPNLLT